MADKTIIVEIKALVNNLTSQLKSATKSINDFAAGNTTLSKTFNILSNSQRNAVKTMKGWSDGQKAVAKGFSELDKGSQTLAQRYAKLSTEHKRLGESYNKINSDIIKGNVRATASQQQVIDLWKRLPSHIKGALTQYNNTTPAVQKVVKAFSGLDASTRSTIGSFARMPAHLRNANSHLLNFGRSARAAQNAGNGFGKIFAGIGKSVFSFNAVSRLAAGSARALGTSLIFSGGSFRNLGVAINVGASALQSFIPMIGGVIEGVTALSSRLAGLGPIGIAAAAALTAALATAALTIGELIASISVAALGGFGLAALASEGLKFNQTLESATVTIGTLIGEYKDLAEVTKENGKETKNYIGKVKILSDAEFKRMSLSQQASYIETQRNAATLRITAAMQIAREATVALTAAAADSIYTTQELMGGFRATYSVLGKYGVNAKQAALLTVQLARVASVAGVSAANMASQITLFLRGAGRITSPLAQFAMGIGLTKETMKQFNKDLEKAKNNFEETEKIMNVFTFRLSAFNVGGRMMSDTWQGIMSNLEENFQLFSGLVTKGFFDTVRNAIFNVEKDVDGSVKRISGALSKIFDIDPKTGTFKQTVKEVRDLFTEPFQKASDVLQRLFNTIGKDIASVIGWLVDKLIEVANWIAKNEDQVQRIYFEVKQIILTIADLIVGWLGFFGVSRDINTTLNNTASNLQYVGELIAWIGQIINGIVMFFAYLMSAILIITSAVTGLVNLVINLFVAISNGAIWIKNIFSWITGIGEQTEYIAYKWSLIGATWGWAVKWLKVGTTAQNNIYDTSARLADIERQRLGLLGDQSQRLLVQQKILRQIELESQNPNSPLYNANIGTKEAELNRRTQALQSPYYKDVRAKVKAEMERNERNTQRLLGTTTDSMTMSVHRQKTMDADREARIDAETAKRIASEQKDIREYPKNRPDNEEGGSGKSRRERVQKRVLDTLFKEEKEYSEARIALELALFNQQQDLAKKRAELFLNSLETQLKEGEVAFTDYYAQINKMAETENQNEINRINSEITALNARHQLELEAIKQDEFKNKAELSIADSASKRVDAERDLAALQIRRKTLEVNYQTELNKLEKENGELQKQSLEYDAIKYANLIKLRDATRDYFNTVRELQTKLNDALDDPFDTKAIEFSLAQITRSYADAYKKFLAVRDSATATPAEKQAAIESLDRIEKLESLERARLVTKNLIARLDIQSTQLEREQQILDEKRKYGLITEAQYIKANNELRLKFIEAYKTRIEELDTARFEALARGEQTEAVRIEGELVNARIEYNKLLNVTEDKLLDINKTLREGLGDFFTSVLEDVNNLGDAFTNLGKLVQRTFQKALVDRLMKSSFFDKLFGNPNQTEGRAAGLIAENGRRQSLDENTQFGGKKPNQEAFLGSTVTLGKDEELDAAKTRLTEAISSNAAETGTLNTQIEILAKKFAEFGVVVDEVSGKIKAVPLAKATPNPVESSKAGSTGGGSVPSSRAQEVLDFVLKPNPRDGDLRAVSKTLAAKYGENEDVIFLLLKSTWGRELSGRINFTKNSVGAQGPFQLTDNRTTYSFKGDALKAGEQLLNGMGGVGGYIRRGLGTYADFFAGPGGGNRGKNTAAYQRDQEWVFNEARSRLFPSSSTTITNPLQTTVDTTGTTPSNPVYVTPVAPNGNTETLETKQTTKTPEDSGLIAQINDKVGLIVTAVGESGLGMLKTSVLSIETKFTEFVASWNTFATSGLSLILEPFVARIVTAISAKQLLDATASNISISEGGDPVTAAYGGYISGPGGPTEDKVPAWLSNGEFVVKAAAVKALGIDKLHAINNADKEIPKFGFGGFVGGLFKSLGKFLKTDTGKLVLGTVIPMVAQKFLGDKAASAISLALPFLFNLQGKGKSKVDFKNFADSPIPKLHRHPRRRAATGGLIGKFAKGGLAKSPFGTFAGKPKFIGGIPAAEGGFWSSPNGEAIKGGAITAAFSIGMALLGRWQANKAWKKQLEEYKKNRTKDPYGLNPETLTFYKKPIITGSRNWLAKGGLISPDMMLRNMPRFAAGGINDMNIEDIIRDTQMGDNPMNITQNINITTPDVHSFRNSRGQLERDLARVTQRGLKRRAPKY